MSRRPWWAAARPRAGRSLGGHGRAGCGRGRVLPWRSVPYLCGEVLEVGRGAPVKRRDLDIEAAPVADELKQRAVDPVHDGAVVLAGPVEPGLVLAWFGEEEVMAQEPAERVDQRQGVSEAGERAVADVHPDVAAGPQQRAQDLSGQRRADRVGVESLQRHVALLQAQRRPGLSPERHRAITVWEMRGRGLGEQVWSQPEEPLDER